MQMLRYKIEHEFFVKRRLVLRLFYSNRAKFARFRVYEIGRCEIKHRAERNLSMVARLNYRNTNNFTIIYSVRHTLHYR